MNVAVVANTKTQAKAIADDLGLDDPWLFGSGSHLAFEGVIADLVLIDESATISDVFRETIFGCMQKCHGKIRRISLQPDI
ncbi:hypothetical protein [Mycobacteroides abscessus]|uniref:hypothetical protein n=1 Tax=Mycobacteroides abscessus TaxID=36809 RepID=UPI000C261335|nr:hypothetical protein [Mycobacteroides abscessus]